MSLLELFCSVDDFCQAESPAWQQQPISSGIQRRQRAGDLSLSEIMTMIIHFHQSQYRTFKAYYTEHVRRYLKSEFPKLVSYARFVQRMPQTLTPLCAYLEQQLGVCSGVSFIDSTTLVVCHNKCIPEHRVFDGIAQRGKNALGWFYGLKLQLVVNDCGELLAVRLTPGNVDDHRPVPTLARKLFGKRFGDKGYISQDLFKQLFVQHRLQLITKLSKGMKGKLMLLSDRLFLRRRAIIQSIKDQLKHISQIEHPPHRRPLNLLVNLIAGLIVYCLQPKKPSLATLYPAPASGHSLIHN
jgi:hypothetical protein